MPSKTRQLDAYPVVHKALRPLQTAGLLLALGAGLAWGSAALAQQAPSAGAAQAADSAALDHALAGNWRSSANRARDVYRHPKATLEFFDVRPDQTVIEITPGGGWYSEVLAPYLRDRGHYIAAVASAPKDREAQRDENSLKRKFLSDPAQYANAAVREFDPKNPVFGQPDSADRVLTFRNVHNWMGAGTAPAMFKAFFDVLRPGGVLGVVDHRAAKGATLDAVKGSGYLPTDYVVKLATDAGFRLVASSEINANPKDTKDYAKGVWTLPPTYTLGAQDRAKYAAIGESDRMTLRFVKPVQGAAPRH
jgi:predicted methyltransferase